MPEIAPWLQAAQPAEYFGRAYAAGAQIASARAQLQAQQERAAMEAAMQQQQLEQQAKIKQQEMEQRNRIEQQRIAISNAYKTAQLSLQEQKLADAEFKIKQDAMEKARMYSARQAYAEAMKQPGADAIKTAIAMSPDLNIGGSSLAMLAREAQAQIPKDMETVTVDGQKFYKRGNEYYPFPGVKQDPEQKQFTILENKKITQLNDEIKKMSLGIYNSEIRGSQVSEAKKDIEQKKKQVNEVYTKYKMDPLYPEVGTAEDEGWTTTESGFKIRVKQ